MSHFNVDERTSLELRFLVPSKAAGVIIGKGGETVKEIREKYEIKVNISDSAGPERILQVIGRSSLVMDAMQVILEKIKDCIPASEADIYTGRYRPRRSRNNGEDGQDSGSVNVGVDLRMLIHKSQAGGVIGRGGERIKELREQVELKTVKVYQNGCPHSTDRVVQMVGEISKVLYCVRTLADMLQTFQIRGPEQLYDARNYDESQALTYGGWLHRSTLKAVQEYGIQALTTLSNPAVPGLPMGGPPNGPSVADSAIAAIAAARASMLSQGTQPPPSRHQQHPGLPGTWMPMMVPTPSGPPPGGAGSIPGGCNRRGDNVNSAHMNLMGVGGNMERPAYDVYTRTVQVSVSNAYMGAIMGRAGVRIRSIREESGADIRVHEPDKNESERIIEITGTPAQITYAQHLLKSCVLLSREKK